MVYQISIDELPEESLEHLLSFFDRWFDVMLVCKKWKRIGSKLYIDISIKKGSNNKYLSWTILTNPFTKQKTNKLTGCINEIKEEIINLEFKIFEKHDFAVNVVENSNQDKISLECFVKLQSLAKKRSICQKCNERGHIKYHCDYQDVNPLIQPPTVQQPLLTTTTTIMIPLTIILVLNLLNYIFPFCI